MNVRIWGTRGSYPVARTEMLRYGGNTTCVEVRVGTTCILLDAGTGLRLLGDALSCTPDAAPTELHMLITHTHWDHIVGFPFFRPIHDPQTKLSIHGLQRTQASLRKIIDNAVSDPLLPFSLSQFAATFDFNEVSQDVTFEIGQDVRVTTARANHPYHALAFRVESANGTLVFVPDTGPFHTILFGEDFVVWDGTPPTLSADESRTLGEMHEAMLRLAEGADWLIYDTQFTTEQYQRFPHWGHGTPSQAIEIAHEAGVRELLLFHHDPHCSDTQMDAIVEVHQALVPAGLRVYAAHEGMELRREIHL